jgi:4-hydroxybenzoate polyprenyltransferase
MNKIYPSTRLQDIIRLLRPHQWAKNLFIFLPLFFNASVNNLHQLMLCIYAFIGFSFFFSSIYCINDALDVNEDKKHPEKSKRPVASGQISVRTAFCLSIVLVTGGLSVQYFTRLNLTVLFITLLYFIMNITYVTKLKQYAIIDVMCIATGFVLRIFIGGYATGVILSHWIVLMTFLLATFLACAKRRDDVLFHLREGIVARKNIIKYNVDFLNAMIMITATVTIVSYIMYTVDKDVIERFSNFKYIYCTSIFVLAAIFRYLQITMVYEMSSSPTKILLKDKFIQVCLLGWIIAFAFIIYF